MGEGGISRQELCDTRHGPRLATSHIASRAKCIRPRPALTRAKERPMVQAIHGLNTELWAFWVVGLVLAITIGKSEVATLSGLPWWQAADAHRAVSNETR